MPPKKKRMAVKTKKTNKPKTKTKPSKTQILVDARKDLVQAIGGKSSGVEVFTLADDGVIGHVTRYLSTGSLGLDGALGVPGLPYGRLVEIYGNEDSGKSTTVLQCMASAQSMGGVAAVVDTENKTAVDYAVKLGVVAEELLVIQPVRKTFESVVRAIVAALDSWIKAGRQDIPLAIFWDSIAGTPTESELNEFTERKDSDEKQSAVRPGEAAKLLSGAMRVLVDKLARANAILVVVNQVYTTFARFGKKKTTYGGKAIRYHATMRLEFVRTGWLKMPGGQTLGPEVKCQVYKNNLGAPRMPVELGIVWGAGIDNMHTIFESLKAARYITSGGGWYTLGIQGQPPRKFQSGFAGLAGLCAADETLEPQLVKIYQALQGN